MCVLQHKWALFGLRLDFVLFLILRKSYWNQAVLVDLRLRLDTQL